MSILVVGPNYYSTQLAVSASTTAVAAEGWTFPASAIRLLNTEATDFYVRLNSTTVATTADMRVRACSEVVMTGTPPIGGLTIYTTSTSASAKLLGVTAIGG